MDVGDILDARLMPALAVHGTTALAPAEAGALKRTLLRG